MDIRDKIIADQAKIIELLKGDVVLLNDKIKQLEHRLGLNSNNSSKPFKH